MTRLRLVARFGGLGRPGLSRFVLGSMGAHALFVGALVLAPALAGRRQPSKPTLVVDLVAPAAVPGLPAPPTPPSPTAQPKPTQPKPAPPKKAPAPTPNPKKTPKPAEKKPVEPAGPETTEPSPSEATPSQVSPAGTGIKPLGGTVGDEFDWYRALVASALLAQWRKPILDELAGGVIEVTVTCEIQRDGSIRDLRVSTPSGVSSLDRSAQRAVLDAVPLPPLPRSWSGSSLSVGFVFQLTPEG